MKCSRCAGTGQIADHKQLLKRRLQKGIKQAVAAKRMGLTPQYLSLLESGDRSWNAKLLAKFRKAVK